MPTDTLSTFEFDEKIAAIDEVHRATAIYTSAHVVDALLDRLEWPQCGGRLIDPSAGDGSFLIRALSRIKTPQGDFDAVRRVEGWELHPGAVASARENVANLLIEREWHQADARRAAQQAVIEGDFITEGPEDDADVKIIAGNPPFLRFGHLPVYFKSVYESEVPDYARGDMLHAFLDRCSSMVPEDGAIAFVTADRWLFNETTRRLREQLGQRVGLSHIARLDCETSFYRPKIRRAGSPPRVHPVEVVLRPVGRAEIPITAAAISPDRNKEEAHCGTTLGDIAEVRIAPWLGPIGIFVIKAEDAGLVPNAVLVPAVDTDDIDPEDDSLKTPIRLAIRTVKDREPDGLVRAHLESVRDKMPKRSATRPWWLPPESITLPLDKPALLIPRIARRLRAIDLPAGVLPINHNLTVCSPVGMSLPALKQLITSDESQRWIERNAPRLENGYYSITTKLLRRMPVRL